MCGLVGLLTFDSAAGRPIFASAVWYMTGLMQRRGPDEGVLENTCVREHSRAAPSRTVSPKPMPRQGARLFHAFLWPSQMRGLC